MNLYGFVVVQMFRIFALNLTSTILHSKIQFNIYLTILSHILTYILLNVIIYDIETTRQEYIYNDDIKIYLVRYIW